MMAGHKDHQEPINFIITTSNPDDVSTAANRKRVRSVAALKSWPGRRRKILQSLGDSSGTNNRQGIFLVSSAKQERKAKRSASKQAHSRPPADTTEVSPISASPSLSPPIALDPDCRNAHEVPRLQSIPDDRAESPPLAGPCPCPQCSLRRHLSSESYDEESTPLTVAPMRRKRMADGSEKPILFTGDLAMITPPASPELVSVPSAGKADPFNCCPIPYKPWYDNILHHMLTIYAPRGWPALGITHEQGLKWEWFMTQNALMDPALYYVRLLYGSGDLIRLGTLQPQIKYWLRDQAIKALNEALADPKRALSDPLILAVGRIALHESLYGDRNAANTIHRPAHARMVQMRGGMAGLDWPPLVKRLMRWGDGIMAMQGGTARLLEDESENQNFSLEESVDCLERWVPRQGESLRSQIKISDLVNDQDAK